MPLSPEEEQQQIKLRRIFGQNVRRERNAIKMTQERLAEAIEVNIRTVQKIEHGDINVLMTTVVRIHRALRCAWDRLMPK